MAMSSGTKSARSKIDSSVQRIVSLVLNGRNLAALPISYDSTLEELRVQLKQRSISIEPDDQFLYKGFRIALVDEQKFHIYEIVDDDIIAMQSHSKSLASQSPNRDVSSYFLELKALTTASNTISHNQHMMHSTSYQLDRNKWKLVYELTSLLRGRCFLTHGPQIGDYPVIRLKPNWRPNSFLFDDARLQVEMSHQQTNNEYVNGRLYNMNAVVNLPFVNITLGSSHNKKQSVTTGVENMSTFFHYKLPRVVHIFDETMIEAEPMFVDEIDKILHDTSEAKNKYYQLCQIFNKYGHGFAAKVVLGGYQVRVQQKQINEISSDVQSDQDLKLSIKGNSNGIGAGVDLEHNRKQTRKRQEMNSNMFIDRSTTGGDSLKSDSNEWSEALKDPSTWRIIEYQRIEPLYKLLDSDRQQKIQMLLSVNQSQEQERTFRCRFVPDELKLYFEEGIYEYDVRIENKKSNRRALSSQTNEVFLFFYAPSYDQWFWKRKEQENIQWAFVKYTLIDELKIKPIQGILQTLQQTNPIPDNYIIQISYDFESIYVPDGTLGKLCKAVNHLFKTHRFP